MEEVRSAQRDGLQRGHYTSQRRHCATGLERQTAFRRRLGAQRDGGQLGVVGEVQRGLREAVVLGGEGRERGQVAHERCLGGAEVVTVEHDGLKRGQV